MKYPNLLERFLTYVKVNTRSDETSTTTPSTQSQVDFAKNILIPEMKRVGLENVYYLPNGFAIGTLPANDPSFTRKIGFISHTWIQQISTQKTFSRRSLRIMMAV